MLTSVFADFLTSLETERALDAPFVCLLQASGFSEIHCIHGSYEFGKDFIARKTIDGQTHQYLFQTKKGDITKDVWTNQLQPQCETMAYSGSGHPNFRTELPRTLVLVATGEMRGQAGVLSQEYADHFERRYGIRPLFWTRNILAQMFSDCAARLLALTAGDTIEHYKTWGRLFSFLETIDAGRFSFNGLEATTRCWGFQDSAAAFRTSIELMLSRDVLRRRGLRCHATLLTLAACRALAADAVSGGEVAAYELILRRLFLNDVDEVLSWFKGIPTQERSQCLVGIDPLETLIAQGRLFHWLEFVCTAVLIEPDEKDRLAVASEFIEATTRIPCTSRPLGERYAISALLVAVTGTKLGIDMERWMNNLAVWLIDRFENDGLGLAHPRATVDEELWRSLGDGLECNYCKPRKVSSIAAALLDACSLTNQTAMYEAIMNDCSAVDLVPFVYTPIDGRGQYYVGDSGVVQSYGGNYAVKWAGSDGWKNAGTHHRADRLEACDVRNSGWLGVASALVLRDRWWLGGLRNLVMKVVGSTGPGARATLHGASK